MGLRQPIAFFRGSPSPWRKLSGWVLLWLVIALVFYQFLYPAYNHKRWSGLVYQGILIASELRQQVTPRLLAARAGEPVNAGLAIRPAGAVTGGRVSANGTIIVHITIPKLLQDDLITVILVPRVDASRTKVDWTCGVDHKSIRGPVPASCKNVLPLPD